MLCFCPREKANPSGARWDFLRKDFFVDRPSVGTILRLSITQFSFYSRKVNKGLTQ